ncbi:SH3 domain-containing protein 19-like [Oopsacas minuta]|uniref:SH3 domain-containing protein 19-like n=1 Tax=Oopsacas minuta TaxID=111878 RepID=A0AAV7K0Z8_9METZ|nr:SH3 domain-containing protein 19-like [Oopsacas minuta]
MSAFYLFCPGSLISKKHRSKSKDKLKLIQQTSIRVDPLYETIPAQTKYSQDNRGKHSFVPTGKLPSSLLNSSTNAAHIECSYTPPVGDHQNLAVVSGQTVHVLQQDKYWSYVIDQHNQLGYVPSEILSILDTSEQETCKNNSNSIIYVNTGTTLSTSLRSDSSRNTPPTTPESLYSKVKKSNKSSQKKPKSNLLLSTSPPQSIGTFHNAFTTFSKTPVEIRTLLHSYRSRQENDLTVRKGEQVTVLNRSDHDWVWVVRGDGEEGFIPTSYSVYTNSYSGK